MTPEISIIMPVLNGERFIAQSIESICRQTFTDYELLVIDDGSTDRTREIVHGFAGRLNLKYVHHETNKGITPSINHGLRLASGAFISFLDHDDLWLPEFLETQRTYLAARPDVGMVHSDIRTIDGEGTILEHSAAECRGRAQPSGFVFRDLFRQSMICGITVMIRKECFERLGTFDERLRWADYHMWLRMSRHYKIDYVPKVLAAYRQHSSQSTRGNTDERADEVPIAVQTIQRLVEDYPEIRRELGDRAIRRRMASFHFDLAYAWLLKGERGRARSCVRRALRLWPTNRHYLGLYAATLLGRTQVRTVRETWRRLRGDARVAADVKGNL
jgi:glycosyltransferase involved in cell wall biosynthesis